MWRSVGTVNPHEPKHNRSRDESNYEPFAQASRMKLNQSHLSGEGHQQQFMNEYFVKKRSSEGMLQRVLSQKNIETRTFVSPPSSLREVESSRIRLKSESGFVPESSLKQIPPIPQSIGADSLAEQKVNSPKLEKGQLEAMQTINNQILAIKNEQKILKKSVGAELAGFQKEIKRIQEEIKERIDRAQRQSEKQKEKKQGINPQLLNRIREQSMRFSERMREIDGRKEQVREKYRRKLQNV